MRRPRYRSRNHPRVRLAADQIRVTNDEILGDLLYPAPPRSVNRVTQTRVGR